MPDASHIHMDEIRTGIVSDPAFVQRECEISEFCCTRSRQANIDGHRLHVETVQGNAMAMSPQVCVAPWSAVSADDVNLRSGAARSFHQIMEKVEKTRVIVVYLARAVIT
jgi:hypothetical protein